MNLSAQSSGFDKFHLRKSAEDFLADGQSEESNKGAMISYTNPKNGAASTSLNIASIYSWRNETHTDYYKSSFSLFLQYDKNNLIDEEQDNIKAGVIYTNNFLSKSKRGISFRPEFSLSSSFRKDFENDFDAIQTNIIFSPLWLDYKAGDDTYQTIRGLPYSLIPLDFISDGIFMLYGFNAGIEYDYRFGNKQPDLNGNLLRTFSQIKIDIEFFEIVSANLDWQYRFILWNSTEFESSSFSFLTAGIDLKFKIKSALSKVGLIYANGENPTNGFEEQSYYAINLSLKVN